MKVNKDSLDKVRRMMGKHLQAWRDDQMSDGDGTFKEYDVSLVFFGTGLTWTSINRLHLHLLPPLTDLNQDGASV